MIEEIDNISREELLDFFYLQARVLADHRPERGPMRVLHVISETEDNIGSNLERAVQLMHGGFADYLGICDSPLGFGYKGYDDTIERLQSLGWQSQDRVAKIQVGKPFNTMTEVQALVAWANERGGDIGIVAPALHLLRAFMTTVSAARGKFTRIYAYTGTSLSWDGEALHSQGGLKATRKGLLAEELGRLKKYQGQEFGGLMTPRGVLAYLDRRDS